VKNSLLVPETDAAAKPDENVALADLVVKIKASFVAAHVGAKAEEDGRAAWRGNTMKLGKGLLLGRELHQNDNNAFNVWLNDNGLGEDLISKDDRAALIGMAEHPEISERVLATTQRRSWQLIWREEIATEVEVSGGFRSVTKTPENLPANPKGGRPRRPRMAPGRPRMAPDRLCASSAQPPDSIDNVRRALIDKCADGKQRTAHQIANKVQYAVSFVEPVLKSLGDAVRVDSTDASAPLYLIESPGVGDTMRELTEKCSGPEWRTRPELASIVGRKEDVVKEALKRLKDDGLVEQTKRADGRFEYRISGEPPLSKSKNLDSLQRNLDLANARIRELERLLRERDADFERQLHDRDVKVAQLEEQLRKRNAEPPISSVVAEAGGTSLAGVAC
jgi:predicted transcriptional regulator